MWGGSAPCRAVGPLFGKKGHASVREVLAQGKILSPAEGQTKTPGKVPGSGALAPCTAEGLAASVFVGVGRAPGPWGRFKGILGLCPVGISNQGTNWKTILP